MSSVRGNVLPEPEPISLRQLRKVIPPHCFERSNLISFGYLFADLFNVSVLIYVGTYIDYIPWVTLRYLTWVVYWFILGSIMTGLWVLAHECGHQAFSPNWWVNDAVGCFCHTVLFAPYWSWKYSHGQHHANPNSMEHDSVHVPFTDVMIANETGPERGKLRRFGGLVTMLFIGWWIYILFNVISSPAEGIWNSHFNPFCSLWKNRSQRLGVIASDLALLLWYWILSQVALVVGWNTIVKFYVVPLLWVNFWLTTITFLQHTDWKLPKFYGEKWSWLRGALGTVDRDYGIFNILHHHIGDTHVVHHIFSKIPHYRAQEATKALVNSGLLSDYYLIEDAPWYVSLWQTYSACWYVKYGEGITWFESTIKKKNN